MNFARDSHIPALGRRATEAYRRLLLANERHLLSGDRRDRSRKRRRRVPLAVLALEPDDHLVPGALALSAGSALVIRPRELVSVQGILASLAYADLLEVPLLADFTSDGLGRLVDLDRYAFDVVRMTIDAGTRRIYPVLDFTTAA